MWKWRIFKSTIPALDGTREMIYDRELQRYPSLPPSPRYQESARYHYGDLPWDLATSATITEGPRVFTVFRGFRRASGNLRGSRGRNRASKFTAASLRFRGNPSISAMAKVLWGCPWSLEEFSYRRRDARNSPRANCYCMCMCVCARAGRIVIAVKDNLLSE